MALKDKKTKSEDDKIAKEELITYCIEDYKMIRDESLQCIRNQSQFSIVSLAFLGSYSVLVQFVLEKKSVAPPIIQTAIFSLIIPLLVTALFTLYLHEAIKMMRAGQYLRQIEDQIHKLIGEEISMPFNWENSLMKKGTHSMLAPLATLFVYGGTALSSLAFSFFKVNNGYPNIICILIVLIVGMSVGLLFIQAINIEFEKVEKPFAYKKYKTVLLLIIAALVVLLVAFIVLLVKK